MEAASRDNVKLSKTGDDNKLRLAKSRQKRVDERMEGVQVSATGGRFKLNRDHVGWHVQRAQKLKSHGREGGLDGVSRSARPAVP
jgi:hypothetical protein